MVPVWGWSVIVIVVVVVEVEEAFRIGANKAVSMWMRDAVRIWGKRASGALAKL